MARAGVASDAGMGDFLLRVIRNYLICSVPLLTAAGELQKEGIPLALIGEWKGVQRVDGEKTMVRPFDSADRWEDVGVLVHLSPWGVVSPLVGEAIGAGVAIVSPQQASEGMSGALSTLLKADVDYARPLRQNFIGAVKQLLKDAGKREGFSRAALKKVAQSQ
jgi:hypothetical protein